MRKTDIEFWALNVIERVENGQPVEDDRVELKSNWVDPGKAARRIAGHANAARGEPILWLIGVDEINNIKGVDYHEYTEWFGKVNSNFDEIAPEAVSINIPYKGVTILAILFDTDRAPYLVKNPSGGSIQFEVPWRDNTSIKTANRSELLRILVPTQRLPIINILSGILRARQFKDEQKWNWDLEFQLYVESMLNFPVVLPFHQCFATLNMNEYLEDVTFKDLKLLPPSLSSGLGSRYRAIGISDSPPPQRPQYDSLTIDGTSAELMIQGPGKFRLIANCETNPLEGDIVGTIATVKANLRPIDVDRFINLNVDLKWMENDLNNTDMKGIWAVGS